MKIIFMADLHLTPYIWTSMKQVEGDAYRAFLWAVRKIEADYKNSTVLFGGDIFSEKTPDSYTEYILQEGCRSLLDAGCRLYGVEGNHDFAPKIPRFELFGITPLDTETAVTAGSRTIAGIPYTASSVELRTRLNEAPPCDYLVMHAPFRHLLGFDGAWAVQMEDIPAHVRNVLVGDIHVKDVRENKNGTRVFSPGATHPRKSGEFKSDHGFFVIDSEKGDYEYISIPGRQFFEYEVLEGEHLNTIETYLTELPRGLKRHQYPVCVLKYPPELTEEVGKLLKRELSAFIRSRETVKVSGISAPAAHVKVPTLLEALRRTVSSSVDHFGLLEELLTAPDDGEDLINKFIQQKGGTYAP
jgi:DNA repair exonuclease SbcCD nuclease subunit